MAEIFKLERESFVERETLEPREERREKTGQERERDSDACPHPARRDFTYI